MTSLLGIIVTAFLSGLSAAAFTAYLTEYHARWAIRREKVEKLYGDSCRLMRQQDSLTDAMSHWKAHGDSGEFYKRWSKYAAQRDEIFHEIELLIGLYFPEHQEMVLRIFELQVSLLREQPIRSSDDFSVEDVRNKKYDELSEIFLELHRNHLKLRNAIGETGRAIVAEVGPAQRLWGAGKAILKRWNYFTTSEPASQGQ